MILQSLYEYYQLKAAVQAIDSKDQIASPGLEWQQIPFLIILDKDGNFLDIEDTRESDGKKNIAKKYLVPHSVKKTSGIKANLLWDNVSYVFGFDKKNDAHKASQRKLAFLEKIESIFSEHPTDKGIQAVLTFLQHPDFDALHKHSYWQEIHDTFPTVAFKLLTDNQLVCQRQAVLDAVATQDNQSNNNQQTCLITGVSGNIERIHPPIKGLAYAQTSGANIVSYNFEAVTSFLKEQGDNAPISTKAAFAYTTALNSLLEKNSRQKILLGETTVVFWADKINPNTANSVDMEDILGTVFGIYSRNNDNPDYNTQVIASLYNSPKTGAGYITDTDNRRFYILGLAPNVSRIAIRFWHVSTVAELAQNIRQHFTDIQIEHGPNEPKFLSLYRLIASTALDGKMTDIPPNLIGDLMKDILSGDCYPQTLLQATLRRIRAEHHINYPRAAILKAYLNRLNRKNHITTEKEITMALSESNHNIGYQLGRLFAVLEKTQDEANPGINATIRDRFYGAASSTPIAVFSNLLKLNTHHLSQLSNRGRAVNIEKLIGNIMDNINDFPAHLTLPDQARFALGYYHQHQNFYAKHDSTQQGE